MNSRRLATCCFCSAAGIFIIFWATRLADVGSALGVKSLQTCGLLLVAANPVDPIVALLSVIVGIKM